MPSLRPMAVSNATPTHTPSAKRGLPTYLTVHKHPRTDTTSPTLGVAIHGACGRARNTRESRRELQSSTKGKGFPFRDNRTAVTAIRSVNFNVVDSSVHVVSEHVFDLRCVVCSRGC